MKEISELTLTEVCSEIQIYTSLIDDEWSESVDRLIDVHRYLYLYSEQLGIAIETELRDQLRTLREQAIIVTRTVSRTVTETTSEVEWL